MISREELKDSGFVEGTDWFEGEWHHKSHPNINFSYEDEGHISYVREGDEYGGLMLKITEIGDLVNFLKYLP